jgi:hypothetical protein
MYTGSWDANTWYQLIYRNGTSGNPSYPADNYWASSQDHAAQAFWMEFPVVNPGAYPLLDPGTYRIRLQVINTSTDEILAETNTIDVVVTAP